MQDYISAQDIDNLNAKVTAWLKAVNLNLKSSVRDKTGKTVRSKENKKIEELAKSLKYTIRKDSYGLPYRIGFSFKKQGIYIHYGVGRNRPISKHSEGIDWFNPILKARLDELYKIIDDFMGGLVINNARMYIPDIDTSKRSMSGSIRQYALKTGRI